MKISKICFLGIISAFLLNSCSNSSKTTSLTGWKKNDEKGWYFSGDKDTGEGGPGMIFIEGGSFTKGQTKDNILHDWNNAPNRQQVRSFYISETEVTNLDYKMYLNWIKLFFPQKEGYEDYKNIYLGSLPDTTVFRYKLSNNEAFSENYFNDNAFDNYPVVGVNWQQAVNYAEWLTNIVNERKLMEKGIINKERYVFEYNDSLEFTNNKQPFYYKQYKEKGSSMFGPESEEFKTNTKNKNYKTQNQLWAQNAKNKSISIAPYRLPTETEWEFAALGLKENREFNRYKGKVIPEYEWKSKKGKTYNGNIKQGIGDYSGIAGYTNDGYAITSPVKSHKANDLGIFGMFGNVAEWTADIYRPIIDNEMSDINYYRGNVFKKAVRIDGQVETIGVDIDYDTLYDGRMVYKNLPGEIKQEEYLDLKNYGDGDEYSLLEPNKFMTDNGIKSKTEDVYNSPKSKYVVNPDGSITKIKDNRQRTTVINDELRVIKGASWRDMAYWMDPAQRRYLDEKKATDWIGFRVAHDRIGSDSNNKRTARGKR